MPSTPLPRTDTHVVTSPPSHRSLEVCLTVAVDDSDTSLDMLVAEMERARQMGADLRVVPVHPRGSLTDASMGRLVALALARVDNPPPVSCPPVDGGL